MKKRWSKKHVRCGAVLYCPLGPLPTLEIKTSINFPLGCASSWLNCNHYFGETLWDILTKNLFDNWDQYNMGVCVWGQHLVVPILWLWKLVPSVFPVCTPDVAQLFLLDNVPTPLTHLYHINQPMSPQLLNFPDLIMEEGKCLMDNFLLPKLILGFNYCWGIAPLTLQFCVALIML